MADVWTQLETDLVRINSLTHNVVHLRKEGLTPETAARRKLEEVRSGLGANVTRHELAGPRLFMRVTGGRVYTGEWWFDADLLNGLDKAYARIYFKTADKKRAVRDMLRELLAISTEFNDISEVWALALPAGERLIAYVGKGERQPLFRNAPVNTPGNRMLVGQAEQFFFPPEHNPLWITKYQDLRH